MNALIGHTNVWTRAITVMSINQSPASTALIDVVAIGLILNCAPATAVLPARQLNIMVISLEVDHVVTDQDS